MLVLLANIFYVPVMNRDKERERRSLNGYEIDKLLSLHNLAAKTLLVSHRIEFIERKVDYYDEN